MIYQFTNHNTRAKIVKKAENTKKEAAKWFATSLFYLINQY